jgi:hypothetical protein
MTLRFSCFIETYGLFFYRSDPHWTAVKNSKEVSAETLRNSLTLYPVGDHITYMLISNSCSSHKYASILLQNIHSPLSIRDAVRSELFLKTEILQTLYQVYFPLAAICNHFTHYDLHSENVLLYQLDPAKYVTFHYTRKNGTVVKFNSRYVSKIIDYGRSFFVDDDINSKIVQKTLCTIPECGKGSKSCGRTHGYAWLNPTNGSAGTFSEDYYITSNRSNISHDLRLLYDIKETIRPAKRRDAKKYSAEIGAFMTQLDGLLKYGVGIQSVTKKTFGTKENRIIRFPNAINNVVDGEKWLRSLLQTPSVKAFHDAHYAGKTKIGDVYIYWKDPAKFVPV